MSSLKKSMKWDEDVYGLEYDLDVYNIVAVNDFNMGAMENKVTHPPTHPPTSSSSSSSLLSI